MASTHLVATVYLCLLDYRCHVTNHLEQEVTLETRSHLGNQEKTPTPCLLRLLHHWTGLGLVLRDIRAPPPPWGGPGGGGGGAAGKHRGQLPPFPEGRFLSPPTCSPAMTSKYELYDL